MYPSVIAYLDDKVKKDHHHHLKNLHQLPPKMAPKAAKHTCFLEAKKSQPKDKSQILGRESVYVLANKPRGKRRNQPNWRRRGGGACSLDDRLMVVTQDNNHQSQNKPQLTPSELDIICYDASRGPPRQFHVEGTDIVPSIRGLRLSICVENSRFPLIAKVTRNMGFQHVPRHRLWNIQWSDYTPHLDMLRSMKRFQQINHFPGMAEICRKDLLSRNLNRMLKLFPGDYRIFPKTWLMPTDAYDVTIYANKHKRSFILKPYSAGQGRGIWITTDLRTVSKREKLICQTYIDRPLLIDGYKFDLRVYTLVTSVDPLRIFVYNEGLARFATQKYVPPTQGNTSNVFMHLTNYCLNRRNSQYMVGNGQEVGSKRKLSAFNKWLVEHNYDVAEFWASVDDAIIKTIISAWPMLRHNYNMCFPKHDKIQASFQLLGFDILVDWKLKPYILEVNHTPSLCGDESVDMEVKRPLIRDTLNMLSTALVDKEQIIRDDRIEHRTRLLRQIYRKKGSACTPTKTSSTREAGGGGHDLRQACSIGALTQQIAWEESHLGNYRRIMPPQESEKVQYYCKFYDQNKSSLLAGTVTTRKREEQTQQAKQDKQQETNAAAAQKPPIKPLRWPGDQPDPAQVDPLIQQSKRRRQEAEAIAKKHRAVIAREIQSQKEQLLAPIFPKDQLEECRRARREKHRKNSPKVSSSLNKAHRRKHQRHLSHRARQQRMLELEAQQDAQFLEKHAKTQRLDAGWLSAQSSKSQISLKSKDSYKCKSIYHKSNDSSKNIIHKSKDSSKINFHKSKGSSKSIKSKSIFHKSKNSSKNIISKSKDSSKINFHKSKDSSRINFHKSKDSTKSIKSKSIFHKSKDSINSKSIFHKSKDSSKSITHKSKYNPKSIKSKSLFQNYRSNLSLRTSSKQQSDAQLPPRPLPTQKSTDWTADYISEVERAEHLSWRIERTNQFNDTQLRAMIFSKMYEHGHLTKNDIKCFPDLLYNLLSRDFKDPIVNRCTSNLDSAN